MATVEPFAALHYNPARYADLSAVTAPPYDVIGPALHAELLAEPDCIVHVDFNPAPVETRYEAAAAAFERLLADGALVRDETPAIYVYEQTYAWGGETLTRRAFIARVRLETLGSGHIHPHERTFSGPKEDRFRLTVATGTILSQHLGIFPDAANEVQSLLDSGVSGEPVMVATGCDGVLNRVWAVTDPAILARVGELMADRDIFIADGHHRYDTMLRYREHVRAELGELPADHPANFTIFVLAGSGDAGLRVMPTHRVVSGWAGFGGVCPLPDFESQPLDLDPTDADALEAAVAEWPISAVGLLTAKGVSLLLPRDPELLDRELADLSPALRELNVSVLHKLILPRLEALGEPQIAYVHRVDEAVDGLANGAQVAFLLRATPLQSVLDVALAHELMPQKSTYFYPKVLTGLAMYPLR